VYPVVLIVAVLTSAAAMCLGATLFGLDVRRLRVAVFGTLDCLWGVIVFFVVNVLVTVGFIAAARTLGGGSPSSYLATDLTLVIVSALQGVVFHLWRLAARGR
jgi:hypothetical protein